MKLIDCKDEKDWLEHRMNYITASDASLYCNMNPYEVNGPLKLYNEKLGLETREDLSEKWAVQRGKLMEPLLRKLFLIDNPFFTCEYHQFGLYVCEAMPFLAATLDGLLTNTETGKKWVLEIKTATTQTYADFRDWKKGIVPQHYICQGIHQLICLPEAEGVIFWAYVLNAYTNEISLCRQSYARNEIQDDIDWVTEQAKEMHHKIENKIKPNAVIKL